MNKTRPLSLWLFYIVLDILVNAIGQEEGIRCVETGKEEL